MAWTAPRTWAVGEVVTAALMNTHVRDNLIYLKGGAGNITLDSSVIITATNAALYLNNTAAGNKRAMLAYRQSATTIYEIGTDYNNDNTNDLYFYDNIGAAFRMAITSGGNVGIGASAGTATHVLQLTGSDDAAKTTTTTWATTSDIRTKTVLGTYDRGLAFLRTLPRIVWYEENGEFGTTRGVRSMNFIAQEMRDVAPAWVHEDDRGILTMNTHELIYALLNAVLEIAARLDATRT